MVFSAPIFLFAFLPIALAVYAISPKVARNAVLVALSALFYVWGGGWFFLLLLGTAAADYLIARGIVARRGVRSTRALVLASVIANIAMLFWFKYAGFTATGLNSLLSRLGLDTITVPHVVLPLAISFFTFQRMSFTFDVASGKIEKLPSFLNYLLFGLLFPHLIAGPIVRYTDIEHEMVDRDFGVDTISEGALRFAHGLAKKVLIADSIAPIANAAFADVHGPPGTAAAWVGALAYTFQLYFDFSGYSDMAIGLGKMFGFDFPENFNRPYSALSITDFWRRWHMTLSGWFRDYLYIPLGGSRGGKAATIRNVAIVFAVTGLWHGAATTFIIWGCYHGAFVIIERLTGLGATDPSVKWAPLRRAVTFLLVVVGWVLFRSQGLRHAANYLRAMFIPTASRLDLTYAQTLDRRALTMMAIAAVTVFLPGSWALGVRLVRSQTQQAKAARVVLLAAILPITLAVVAMGNFSPFLYFQF